MRRTRILLPALLYFSLLLASPARCEPTSSELPPSPPDADLLRDAPLFPPLQDPDPSDHGTELALPRQPYANLDQNDNIDNIDPVDIQPSRDDVEFNLQNTETLNSVEVSRENDFLDNGIENNLQQNGNLESDQEYDTEHTSKDNDPSDNDIEFASLDPEVLDNSLENASQETELSNDGIESSSEQPTLPDEADGVTNIQRDKRSSGQQRDKTSKPSERGRVRTGDTILNIRGAVRDAIGDAGAAPGPRGASRLDTFVIRPAARARPPPPLAPPHDQVPRRARELLVEAHSRARVPCDLANVTNLRWYKDNEPLNLLSGGPGEAAWTDPDGAAVVARATRGDAGAWRCAGDQAGRPVSALPVHLLVYEAVRSVYLAVDGRRLDAGNTWVPVRDKTELGVRCVAEGGVPPPELTWRLLALEPALEHRSYLRIQRTNYSVDGVSSSHAVVTAARELHNATLQCEARQRRPAPATPPTAPAPDGGHGPTAPEHVLTAKLEIHVTYPPSFVISRWPGFGVALSAGGAAALRCDVDANPPARAWWARDLEPPASSASPAAGEEGGEGAGGAATLRWAALRSSHAGWYRCRARWLDADYSSIGYYLNVIAEEEQTEAATEPVEEEEPEHQKVDVPVGGNVQLHCPKGSVGCWWRRVLGNSSEAWAPAGSHHAHGVLGIKEAVYEEGGEYRCVGARGGAREAGRLRELKRVTLRVAGGATAAALSAQPANNGWRLECGACGRGVRVSWLRAGRGPAAPADLTPDLAQHCWRAVLHVLHHDEVWCVAATAGGGAVAVFPPRAPHPSPAPARHTVRAPHSAAVTSAPGAVLPGLALLAVQGALIAL